MIQAVFNQGQQQFQQIQIQPVFQNNFKKKRKRIAKATMEEVFEEQSQETSRDNQEESNSQIKKSDKNVHTKIRINNLSSKTSPNFENEIDREVYDLPTQNALSQPQIFVNAQFRRGLSNTKNRFYPQTDRLVSNFNTNEKIMQLEFETPRSETINASSASFITQLERRRNETQAAEALNGPQITYINSRSMRDMNYQFMKYVEQNVYDNKTVEVFKHLRTIELLRKSINHLQVSRVSAKSGNKRVIYSGETKIRRKVIHKFCCKCNIRIEYCKEKRGFFKKLLSFSKIRTYRISLDNSATNAKVGYVVVKSQQYFQILSVHKRHLKSRTNVDQLITIRSDNELSINFPNYFSWQEKILVFCCVSQILMKIY
eukprot:403373828